MLITKIKLVNYRQHADFEQDITGTVVAVVGENGSGKSNLLGGVQYAFTGEQPGFKKNALLKWGAKTGYVRVDFTHGGKQGYVSRNVHNTNVEFRYGDDTYTGIADVAEAITAHLGMDKDTARQSIFVRQAELDSILFTEPAARERAFQRLLGIGDADKIYRSLGEVLAELPKPQSFDEYITQGEEQLAATQTRIATLREQRDQMEARLSTLPSIETLNQRQTYLANIQRCHDQLVRLAAEISEIEARVAATKAEQSLTTAPLGSDYETLRAERLRLETLADMLKDRERAEQLWRQAQAEYDAVGTPAYTEESAAELKARLDEMTAALNQQRGHYTLHKNLYDALNQASALITECPVCGAAVSDARALSDRLQGIMTELTAAGTAQGQQVATMQVEYTAMTNAITAWQTGYARVSTALQMAQANVDALPARPEGAPTLADVEAQLAEVVAKVNDERQHAARSAAMAAQIAALSEQLSVLHAKQAALLETCRGFQINPEEAIKPEFNVAIQQEMVNIPGAMHATTELHNQLAGLRGMLDELTLQHASAEQALTDLKARKQAQNNVPAVVDTITKVRDWFHYSNGPRALSAMVMGALVDDINKYLDKFSAPFTVAPTDDGTGFTYTYNDDRVTPEGGADASMLSGGQRVQLAIAFRFATYAMFAADLGILSLDEPTTYLDENNVGRFCVLLENVKKTATDLNLQVWLATHERGVMPYVDTIIEVGPTALKENNE